MREATAPTRWTHHFVYRSERLRTTWKLRFGVLAAVILALWLTSGLWTVAIARSLVCEASCHRPADGATESRADTHVQPGHQQ
jgi:hypothetical protein